MIKYEDQSEDRFEGALYDESDCGDMQVFVC